MLLTKLIGKDSYKKTQISFNLKNSMWINKVTGNSKHPEFSQLLKENYDLINMLNIGQQIKTTLTCSVSEVKREKLYFTGKIGINVIALL